MNVSCAEKFPTVATEHVNVVPASDSWRLIWIWLLSNTGFEKILPGGTEVVHVTGCSGLSVHVCIIRIIMRVGSYRDIMLVEYFNYIKRS